MQKRIDKLPTIKFNKYVYLGIIIFFVLLLGRVKWQQNAGLKIWNSLLFMWNYDKQVELSTGDRAKYEAEVQKYDNLIGDFTLNTGKDAKNRTNAQQEWFLNKAENLYKLGDSNKAVKTLYKALEYFPDSPWALEMLANVYAQAGEYQYALNMYQKIIKADPENQSLYAPKIIEMYVWLKDADKAGKLYIEYIKNWWEKNLELINKIRVLRELDPMQE